MTSTNLSGQPVDPQLLTAAIFRCVDEMLETHTQNVRADGCDEESVRRAVQRYRGQLLEQFLRIVIKNGHDWFRRGDLGAALEAFPTSGVRH
jgi:hypothetical protein